MAFGSLVFAGIVLLVLFLGFLFLVGLILLIVGIVRKRKPKNAGKKSPVVCIVSGAVCLLAPIGTAICLVISLVVSLFSGRFGGSDFRNVTEGWRKGGYVSDTKAKWEAINGLLTAADAGDRDSFERMFTPRLQKKGNFREAIDAFFESYPNGLSLCELDGGYGMTTGWQVETASTSYTCFLDGEWYYMGLEICFRNPESPDDVGVTFFCIENLEAYALDRDYGKDEFVACEIKNESEVTARLINRRGYLFTPTPDRSITVEQMKSYLEKYDDLDDLAARIGKPNASKQYSNSRGADYCYELVPENGEPRYACIDADYIGGENYWYHICSDVEKLD